MLTRRDVMRSAVAAALVNGAWGAPKGMFVALNTSLTGGKAPWPEFARLAQRTGYGGTDVNLGGAMKEGLDATRSLLAELRLRTSFCSLPVNPTRDEEAF